MTEYVVRVDDKSKQGSVDSPFIVEAESSIDAIDKVVQFIKGLRDVYRPRSVVRIEVDSVDRLARVAKALRVKLK